MKKIGRTMSLFMGLVMSFSLSLTGNLLSGHFAIRNFLVSFACSFMLSLLIGFLIPMKPLSDKACEKVNAKPGTIKAKLTSAVLSSLIYTPILTISMVFMNTTMAGIAIDRQLEELDTKIAAQTQECEALQAQADALSAKIDAMLEESEERAGMQAALEEQKAGIAGMQGGIEEMKASQASMRESKPVFIKAVIPSLGVSLLVALLLGFFVQPLILKAVMKHYGIPV